MPSISGIPVLATKDSVGTIIQPINTALRFVGATVAVDGNAQTVITVGAAAVTASNLGAGTGVFASIVGTDLQFKSLVAGSGVTITSNATEITLNATGADTASNLGAGTAIFAAKVAGDFQFKTLIAGSGVTITSTATEVTINAASADTASNLGAGTGVFASKVGSDFQFKSIVAGSGVTITSTATEITISSAAATGTWLTAGNVLTGAEVLGSTNGVDVNMVRGGTSYLSLTGSGISINSSGASPLSYNFAQGSLTFGLTANLGTISATGSGAIAHGFSNFSSSISASSSGSHAGGHTIAGGAISASNSGAFVHGYSTSVNPMSASGNGSFTLGYAASFAMTNTGDGSMLGGASTYAAHSNSGYASFIWGESIACSGIAAQAFGQEHLISANNGTAFGENHVNSSYASMILGRFGSSGGTAAGWVSTDPVLTVGNGANAATRNNAFVLYKDGLLNTTGGHVDSAIRMVVGASAISPRIDRTIVCSVAGAGGALTLPAGVNGQTFIFTYQGTAVGAPIYIITPSGGDVLDVNVNPNLDPNTGNNVVRVQYLAGTWYAV